MLKKCHNISTNICIKQVILLIFFIILLYHIILNILNAMMNYYVPILYVFMLRI